jgi:hypothetical protein
MDVCLFDRSEHTKLPAFFRETNASQGESRDLHDGHDQSKQSDKPRIPTTKLDDVPLEINNVSVVHIQ